MILYNRTQTHSINRFGNKFASGGRLRANRSDEGVVVYDLCIYTYPYKIYLYVL